MSSFPAASVKFVAYVVLHSDNHCEVLSGLELVMLICYSQSDQCSLISTDCICGHRSVSVLDAAAFYWN